MTGKLWKIQTLKTEYVFITDTLKVDKSTHEKVWTCNVRDIGGSTFFVHLYLVKSKCENSFSKNWIEHLQNIGFISILGWLYPNMNII